MNTHAEKPSVSTTGGGILNPMISYRFRVLFGFENMIDDLKPLTQQVAYFKIDMKNKIVKTRLRQPMVAGFFHMIDLFLRHKNDIYVEPLDGGNNYAICTLRFSMCECIKHSIDFDYGSSNIMCHDMEFSYEYLEEFQAIDWEARKAKLEAEDQD